MIYRVFPVLQKIQTRKDKPHWIQGALEKISVHGLIWYQRSNSKIIRSCIVIFALLVLFGLPIWTIFEFIKFYQTIQIKTETEASRGIVFRYPNLTVCHSRYFDKQLLKGSLLLSQSNNWSNCLIFNSKLAKVKNYISTQFLFTFLRNWQIISAISCLMLYLYKVFKGTKPLKSL